MKNYKFYKEESGKWYIDLPIWLGNKEELEMVMGADTMLDILAEGENTKNLLISKDDNTYANYFLKKLREDHGGCYYEISGMNITPFEVWLCEVAHFVFGGYPNNIYIRS